MLFWEDVDISREEKKVARKVAATPRNDCTPRQLTWLKNQLEPLACGALNLRIRNRHLNHNAD